MIYNMSKDLKVFTNGASVIPPELAKKLEKKGIQICDSKIEKIEQENGQIQHVILEDGSKHALECLFVRTPIEQHLSAPKDLGCTLDPMGFIQVDDLYRTSVPGVFAVGDCTTVYRALSIAIGAGTKSTAWMMKELSEENFAKL